MFRFNEHPVPTAKMSLPIMQMFDRRQTRDIAIVNTNGKIKETVARGKGRKSGMRGEKAKG